MPLKAKSAKAKGRRLEKWFTAFFNGCHELWCAREQPGSGIYQDFPHDNELRLGEWRLIAECKSWKHGWRTGDNALGQADLLCIKRDYGEPCFYLPARTMKAFAEAAAEAEELREKIKQMEAQNV